MKSVFIVLRGGLVSYLAGSIGFTIFTDPSLPSPPFIHPFLPFLSYIAVQFSFPFSPSPLPLPLPFPLRPLRIRPIKRSVWGTLIASPI